MKPGRPGGAGCHCPGPGRQVQPRDPEEVDPLRLTDDVVVAFTGRFSVC